MRILEVQLEEFMVYKKLNLALTDLGLIGIQGNNADSTCADSNGAGKSAIIEAIVWGLFGQTIRALKDKNDVVNRVAGKNCLVSLKILKDDSTYTITRTRAHKKLGNALNLYCGDEEITKGTMVETQKFLNELIGFEYQAFVNTIVFGQGDVRQFSQATDAERKAMFEKLLDTEVYTRCLNYTKQTMSDINRELELLDKDFSYLAQQKESIEQELAGLQVRKQGYEQERQEKLKALEKQLTDLGDPGDLENLEKQVQESRSKLQELTSQKAQAQQELDSKIADLNDKKYQAQSKIDAQISELKQQISSHSATAREIQRRKDKLTGLEGKCPTCEGDIDPSRVQSVVKALDSDLTKLQTENAEFQNQINMFEQSKTQKATQFAKSIKEIEDQKTLKSQEFEKSLQGLEDVRDSSETRLRDAKVIASKQESFNRAIQELKTAKEPYTELIEQKAKQGEGIKNKTQEQANLRQTKLDTVEGLKFWEKGFGLRGIKSLILEEVVPYLNDRLGFYTNYLTNGEISIALDTQSELKGGGYADKMNVTITSSRGETSNYESSSGGERRRIDACLLFALQDLAQQRANKVNILFIDEMFDVLDELGVDKLISLLWKKQQDTELETIIVISHNKSILSSLPRRMEVTKRKGSSTVKIPTTGGSDEREMQVVQS